MERKSNLFNRVVGQHIKKLTPAILISTLMTYMIFVAGPVDLYVTNIDEFWFNLFQLLPPIFLEFVIADICCILLYLILININILLYRIVVLVEFCCFIVLYLHGNILTGGMSSFSGDDAQGFSRKWKLISVLVIVAAVAIVVAMVKVLKMKKALKIVQVVSGFMLLVMLVSGVSEVLLYDGLKSKDNYVVTTNGMWKYSDDENFIIFVLDAVGSDGFKEQLEEYNKYSNTDLFKDFTFYSNTCGKYPFTQFSVDQILTGVSFTNQMPFTEFTRTTFAESPFLNKMYDSDFDVSLYNDFVGTLYELNDKDFDKLSNASKEGSRFSSYRGLYESMNNTIMYRYLPYFLKDTVDLGKIDFASLRVLENIDAEVFVPYNDVFMNALENAQVETVGDKQFKYIHIDGGHRNSSLRKYEYDRNMNKYEGGFTYEAMKEQQLGCCLMVDKYFDILKANGLYDNSVIVVMSDHGSRIAPDDSYNSLEYACNPILFIKGKGETAESGRVSKAPVSYDDLEECFMRLLSGADSTEVFDCKEGDYRPRYYYYYKKSEYIHDKKKKVHEYEIIGDVSDPANTTYTDTGNKFKAYINKD